MATSIDVHAYANTCIHAYMYIHGIWGCVPQLPEGGKFLHLAIICPDYANAYNVYLIGKVEGTDMTTLI